MKVSEFQKAQKNAFQHRSVSVKKLSLSEIYLKGTETYRVSVCGSEVK